MDPDLEELKELMRIQTKLSQDTHRMVRSMYRSTQWEKFWRCIWILVALGAAVYSYYYLQPYIQKIEQLYTAAQAQLSHVQSIGSGVSGH